MNLLRLNQWRTIANLGLTYLIVLTLGFSLVACGSSDLSEAKTPKPRISELQQSITEVSPPVAIQRLHQVLDQYQPQVKIISPQPDEVLQDNTVNVQLNVENLPIFQQETLGLGPHLQVILDRQPTQAIYDLSQPLIFEDLEPGTHTLRVFAAYPWDESYKNPEAYDQTVFHLFTQTPNNNPDLSQPLLTLNQPTGTYGAEPILLDFYLANLPNNPIDPEDVVEDTVDWKIQMTLNGERFLIDQWQPIYIKGVKSGKNWIQLQYLNQQGQPLNNVYNNTAKVFTYDPEVNNSLSQLFTGEFSEDQLQAIADPDYVIETVNPVSEVTEAETSVEPEMIQDNPLEEIEPVSEEPILSPVEEVLEDSEEPNTAEIPETEAVEKSVEEAIEEPTAAVEPIVEKEFPEIEEEPVVEEEKLSAINAIEPDSDLVEETSEEPKIVEESAPVSAPILEEELPEISDIEADSEPVEVVVEDTVEETLEQPEAVEESTTVSEPVFEEELPELSDIETDNLETLETVETVTDKPINETVIQIDETAETPIVVEEPVLEDTMTEEGITEIPAEIIEIDETPNVVLEESPEASPLEQPESDGWFNSILKRIKQPFVQQESTEMVEPQPIDSVTLPEEVSTSELTEIKEPQSVESVNIPEETSASESTPDQLSELREWFNSISKKIKLPFLN